MAEIGKSLKGIWLKSMEAISNTASNIASNTKYKVDEMNLVNRRREILSNFSAQCYEMWQKGVRFPEELEAQLQELSQLDEALNAIRVEKVAGVKSEEAADEAAAQDNEQATEEAVMPISEKIDSAVDAMGATFKKLGTKLEGGIEALTRAMKPKMEVGQEQENQVEEPAQEPAADEVPTIQVEETEPAQEEVSPLEGDLPEEPKAPEINVEDERQE